jgi:ectoine hydroxylase-related dioxygenase (phytanoyl-CoA dioxygenase family)
MTDTPPLPSKADSCFFEENGYWLGPKVLGNGQLERLHAHMDKVYAGECETGRKPWSASWQPGDDPTALRKTDNAHWADLTLRELALSATIGAMAARLMNVDVVRLWHDQLLYKPGGGKSSGNVGWHQDYHYWQCADRPDLLTAWVAFDDVDEQNGCMHFVPRSHRWGMMEESDFFNTDLGGQEQRMAIPPGEKFEKIPVVLKAGEVSFHHSLTIHGSGPNLTQRPRRSFVIHMMAGDVRYKSGTWCDAHMNAILLKGKDGDPFAGELFPTLYDSRL